MVSLAAGSVVAISFYLPVKLLEKEDQPMQEMANKRAQQSGTPFYQLFFSGRSNSNSKESFMALKIPIWSPQRT